MIDVREFGVRRRRIIVVAAVSATFAGLTALAVGQTLAGGAAPQLAAGSGKFSYVTVKQPGTAFGSVVASGTITTRTIPAAIKPGEPVRFTSEARFVETYDASPCPFQPPGVDPGSNNSSTRFPLIWVRPGHGEDILDPRQWHDIDGTMTTRGFNAQTTTCGPPRITRPMSSDVRMTGAQTALLPPGCYAYIGYPPTVPAPPDTTYSGTVATLSVGGVNCAAGGSASAAPRTFTDTFSSAGQARPHAVAVPPKRTHAVVTIRWTKPTDRFTVTAVTLAPGRTTSSVGKAQKLKITFGVQTPKSMSIRIAGLTPGKLKFKVVGKKVGAPTTVRTSVALKS